MRHWSTRVLALLALATIVPACGGGSSGGGVAPGASLFGIWTRGGVGTTADGGNGDWCEIDSYGGGDINIRSTGSVNAASTIPAYMPYLGATPLTAVTATQALATAELSTPLAGATGLNVPVGVTLTVSPNDDTTATVGTKERVWVVYPEGVYIAGTLIVAVKDGIFDTADFNLTCSSFVIAPGGSLILTGANNGAGAGRLGGTLTIYANETFVNAGTISTVGGNGSTVGGNGGFLDTYGDSKAFNSGTMVSNGGTGAAGIGGNAGYIDLEGYYGAHNNGSLSSRGGAGSAAAGGGADIYLASSDLGGATNAGTLNTSGGSSTDTGNGGTAGNLEVYAYSGQVRLAGTLQANGGNGGPNGGIGGNGNDVDIYCYGDTDYISNNYPGDAVFIGAQIESNGGTGTTGGNANSVYISKEDGFGYANTRSIWLVGYVAFDSSGGNGAVNGGDGGDTNYPCYMYSEYSFDEGYYLTGNAYNEVPWVSVGGNGANGDGGQGGDIEVDMYSTSGADSSASACNVINHGSWNMSGGTGAGAGNYGGDGGNIYIYNYQYDLLNVGGGFLNTGAWLVNGGNGPFGGDGGYAEIYQYDSNDSYLGAGDVVNSGLIDLHGGVGSAGDGGQGGDFYVYLYSYSYQIQYGTRIWGWTNYSPIYTYGGNGTVNGGDAGYVEIYGTWFLNNGAAIVANGGNGGTGSGGDGDYVYLYLYEQYGVAMSDEYFIRQTGTLSSYGGTGATAGGDAGDFYIDSFGAVTISGSILCYGGAGAAGGDGGYINMYSDVSVTVGGAMLANGANGSAGTGGWGDDIYIWTKQFILSGATSSAGGNGTGAAGGNADYTEFWSTDIGSILTGSSANSTGGTGTVAGLNDYIMVDGVELAATVAGF